MNLTAGDQYLLVGDMVEANGADFLRVSGYQFFNLVTYLHRSIFSLKHVLSIWFNFSEQLNILIKNTHTL